MDQAALQAAIDSGLDHGGWCPPERLCETGTIPAIYQLVTTPEERSENAPEIARSMRTEWNARDSDGTLIIHGIDIDPGTKWTISACHMYNKPYLIIHINRNDSVKLVTSWIREHSICILNVAGPSEKQQPRIFETAYGFIKDLINTPG